MAEILWRGDTSDGNMRGEGRFEILQDEDAIRNQMWLIEKAGRVCYQSNTNMITDDTAEKFIRMILRRGHESVIEHSLLTVRFSNVSRGFTHEMVRHRLAAFSQESTRYVDYAGDKLDLEKAELAFVVPPHREFGESEKAALDADWMLFEDFGAMVSIYKRTYKGLRKAGWAPQDARQFLPIGVCAQIVVSANFRAWRHIFRMRTQKAAHWEIRYIMCDLLANLKEIIPVIFEDFEFSPKLDSNGYRYTL